MATCPPGPARLRYLLIPGSGRDPYLNLILSQPSLPDAPSSDLQPLGHAGDCSDGGSRSRRGFRTGRRLAKVRIRRPAISAAWCCWRKTTRSCSKKRYGLADIAGAIAEPAGYPISHRIAEQDIHRRGDRKDW